MAEPLAISDPALRRAVDKALERVGELLVFIRYTHSGGARDWFLVQDQALETDEVESVDEWLKTPHEGERLVGAHPLLTREEFYPDVSDAFLAYAAGPDGTVRPGAY